MMSTVRNKAVRATIYTVAVAVGIWLAIPRGSDHVDPSARAPAETPANVSRNVVVASPSVSAERAVDTTNTAEPPTIFAGSGLSFRPELADGVFIGYRVLGSGGDPRFGPGLVITQINGQPVEDSAAGGELLIAMLRNPDAIVTVVDLSGETTDV